ncbi:MAG: (2E,6Z)-farnesyl diphosphate synthase, partial [uncultured Actinomycetospora sp.]
EPPGRSAAGRLLALRAAPAPSWCDERAAPAHRGDPRREPAVGPRGRPRRPERRAPRGRGEDRRPPGLEPGGGRRDRHPVPAVHRQPRPAHRGARPAPRDHRRCGGGARGAGPPLAAAGGGQPGRAAGPDRRARRGRGGGDVRPRRHAGQRRHRLRRAAGDRRRRAQAAAAPRRGGHVHRGARRGPRRRPHRRAPLHVGPARSGPGDPHLGGATPLGVPHVAVRVLRVLLHRGALAAIPAHRFPAGPARLFPPQPPLGRL